MSYSRNFGMRGFENIVRDGRFRVPSTGTPLKIGEPVLIDGANVGRLKQAGAAAAPGQNAGIVVYEHIQFKSDALVSHYDSIYAEVPLGQYAQMIHGPGAKVWFRNTKTKTANDGRLPLPGGGAPAFDFVTTTIDANLADKGLVPAGGGKWRAAANGETAWLYIEQVNPVSGLVEARFNF